MKSLFFDIETIPAHERDHDKLGAIYQKRRDKKIERLEAEGKDTSEVESFEEGFSEFLKGTSFDGGFGRVCCIALAVNDDEIRVYTSEEDNESERKVLKDFWSISGQCDQFVGHNIMDFDLRFLLQRSIVLGVEPSWRRFQEPGKKPWEMGKYLSFSRYNNIPIFDTMKEWVNWGQEKIGLEHVAFALDIPTPKGEGIDGSQVWTFFQEGKLNEIAEYCKRDVETVRSIYKKMTFASK